MDSGEEEVVVEEEEEEVAVVERADSTKEGEKLNGKVRILF